MEVFAGRAATLAPGDAEAASLLASASLLSGEPASALERADGALRIDPGLELALRVRALALARLRRTAEARAAFEALLEAGGGSWQSWAHYGAFLADTGDRAAAVLAFEDASDLAPDSREAWKGCWRRPARKATRRSCPARKRRCGAWARREGSMASSAATCWLTPPVESALLALQEKA